MYLNSENSIFISDDLDDSAKKIVKGLNQYVYSYKLMEHFRSIFSNEISIQKLKNYLEKLLIHKGYNFSGEWFLKDLSTRLCGHGNINSFQIYYNESYFFDWFDKARNVQNNFRSEDDFYSFKVKDKPYFYIKTLRKIKDLLKKIIK